MILRRNFWLIIVCLIIFFLYFFSPFDTDLGWHLRYGDYFLKTGKLLRENDLTYFLNDYHWAHSYTLYQITVAVIYRISGLFGISLFGSLLAAFGFYLFYLLTDRKLVTAALLFFFVTVFGWTVFDLGFRAQSITFFGLLLTINYLERLMSGRFRLVWFSVPLFLLWANFHGGFILGLAVIAARIASLLIEIIATRLKQKRWEIGDLKRLILLVQVLCFGFFASLVNPFGFGVYLTIFRHGQVRMDQLIAEWVPPLPLFSLLILILCLYYILSVIFLKKSRSGWLFWLFTLLIFSNQALSARRNLPLFFLMAALAFYYQLKPYLENRERLTFLQKRLTKISALAVLFLTFCLRFWPSLPTIFHFDLYSDRGYIKYPWAAVEYLKDHPLAGGNVFNAYEWGGFLEWQLPDYKYFVDGRMPAWETPFGESPYSTFIWILHAPPGWEEILNAYKTEAVFIGTGTLLNQALGINDNWRRIYGDKIAVIYEKK